MQIQYTIAQGAKKHLPAEKLFQNAWKKFWWASKIDYSSFVIWIPQKSLLSYQAS